MFSTRLQRVPNICYIDTQSLILGEVHAISFNQ